MKKKIILFLMSANMSATSHNPPSPKKGEKHSLEPQSEQGSPKRARTTTSSSSSSSSSSSQPRVATTSTALSIEPLEEQEKVDAGNDVTLISKEGARFRVPREVALDPQVSEIIAHAFTKNDRDVEIPLGAISQNVLRILTPILWQVHHIYEQQIFADEKEKKSRKKLVESVAAQTVSIGDTQLPQFLNAADYLHSQLLLEALALRYAGVAHAMQNSPHQLVARLHKDGLGHDLLELVSQMYFLRYNIDGDPIIFPDGKTKTTIPFDMLAAWGKFSPELLTGFPNLGTAPNEARQVDPELANIDTALAYAARDGSTIEIAALLKLKDIDPNAQGDRAQQLRADQPPLMEVRGKDLVAKAALLLKAGAHVNRYADDGTTALHIILSDVEPPPSCRTMRDIVQLFAQYNYDFNRATTLFNLELPLAMVLNEYSAEISEGVSAKSLEYCKEAVELMLKASTRVNPTEGSHSPLALVTGVRGAESMVEILKKAGAKLRDGEVPPALAPTQPAQD